MTQPEGPADVVAATAAAAALEVWSATKVMVSKDRQNILLLWSNKSVEKECVGLLGKKLCRVDWVDQLEKSMVRKQVAADAAVRRLDSLLCSPIKIKFYNNSTYEILMHFECASPGIYVFFYISLSALVGIVVFKLELRICQRFPRAFFLFLRLSNL